MADVVAELVDLLAKARPRPAHLQVLADQSLLPIPIRWEDDESLAKLLYGSRVLVAQDLVHEITGTAEPAPVHRLVIDKRNRNIEQVNRRAPDGSISLRPHPTRLGCQ